MQLTASAPAALAKIQIANFQPQAAELPASTPVTQRPRLSMVWHKEFDGKRDRMVAQWAID